jgi:hypothetical protein
MAKDIPHPLEVLDKILCTLIEFVEVLYTASKVLEIAGHKDLADHYHKVGHKIHMALKELKAEGVPDKYGHSDLSRN